jgi:aryl-alcohol dehydrogenase-like predicted oxidoreductase
LRRVAGDLLPKLSISTKVGFFPAGNSRAEHSLDPGRLLQALETTNADLGRPPDLVFLHNPEHSLARHPDRAKEELAAACSALQAAREKGLCAAWGVSTWNPTPITTLIDSTTPRSQVLMVRAGLTVSAAALDAAQALTARWQPNTVWGMSPFGGDTDDPVWKAFDPRVFLRDRAAHISRLQAAFRVAYALPPVDTIAISTDNPDHLRDLLNALAHEVDDEAVHRYRALLREQGSHQPA